ncbi:hypothetical protein GOP47_0025368 [Adiantum capillus-veneris]|uniref:Uncharacterized protein n=1 Tax=Adiantum capillus-veneris TaxID=13818 RepID=A0A9D4Z2Y1_ADICA|nr:hypothetical protein GOP47_0025368 [Adiantum capillus-veneris]
MALKRATSLFVNSEKTISASSRHPHLPYKVTRALPTNTSSSPFLRQSVCIARPTSRALFCSSESSANKKHACRVTTITCLSTSGICL